jgi:Tol biopolymer transport system component
MALLAGTRLGPYEITGPAGVGGMGEVYRARDARLERTVAIKVLPPDLAADADRRRRFEREARVIASLSHPNICALHDVGSDVSGSADNPVSYLVMEYLEGDTLADRLARGALPVPEVIRYGSEIAMALHAAHRQQIVHRDLKPGNIMLTRGGVKVLDFGLARASATALPGGDSLTTYAGDGVTMPGAVLGTLPYMAPEQVEGRPADTRSDIFALGSVLYEMATGHRAFTGSSPAAVASAILTSNPPPVLASLRLDRIIRTSLEKDPERRWQSAHDVAVQLAALAEPDPRAEAGSAARAWLPWAVTSASVLAALAVFAWGSAPRGEVAPADAPIRSPVALPLAPPPGGAFNQFVEWIHVAVSPDGRTIAYAARLPGDPPRLWLRDLGSITSRPLEGTDDVTSMFWSPDGRSLAFFAAGRLMRVDLPGGAPVKISDVRRGIGQAGSWGANGQILFSSVQGEVLQRVDAHGGTPVDLLRPDSARGEIRLLWPSFLPDGRRFLYLAAQRDDSGMVMLGGPDREPREVLRVKSSVQYVDPGYLLYVNDSTLVARRFDPVTGELSGDPIAIADRVSYFRATGLAHFSASPAGVIAYQQSQNEARIASFDRSGREVRQLRPPGGYQSFRLSPDGRRLVFDRTDPSLTTLDAWLLDLDRDTEIRLTSHPTAEAYPIWGPDETILYASVRGASPQLVRRSIRTGAEEALSPDDAGAHFPQDVSRDGQRLLYGRRLESGIVHLMMRRFSGQDAVIFRQSASDGRFSPDGTYVAFVSSESGQPGIVIAPAAGGAATPVSTAGGRSPRWRQDGRELFYIGPGGELMAVPVRLQPALELGKPVQLFHARGRDGWWGTYEVAPDGQFFALVRTKIAAEQPLTVLVNWRPQ